MPTVSLSSSEVFLLCDLTALPRSTTEQLVRVLLIPSFSHDWISAPMAEGIFEYCLTGCKPKKSGKDDNNDITKVLSSMNEKSHPA